MDRPYRFAVVGPWRGLPALVAVLLVACSAPPAETDVADAGAPDAEEAPVPRGLQLSTPAAGPGYVLYSPLSSGTTYLLDPDAQVVHTWESSYSPHSLYLLDDGTLLRPGRDPDTEHFRAGGAMGIVQKLSWDSEVLWEWKLSDENRILHHDVEPLPNGNFLAIGWELRTPEEARAVGRREDLIPEKGLWPDFLIEVEPQPPDSARIVWEWRVWDHLVQNVDPALPHYGDPAKHPNRLDINAGGPPVEIDSEELAQLRALGYVPDAPAAAQTSADGGDEDAETEEEEEMRSDFLHINAVDWHPELDQIAMTVPELGEVWIIRRPRSTEEAAGPAGDLIYRWGNPSAYGRGAPESQRLFYPHDVQWIPAGYPGEGNLTVFNNGRERPDGEYTSIEELEPPLADEGAYPIPVDGPWEPEELVWSYTAPEPESFFASFISGAHRLPNGNTFVTDGPKGRLFEVTQDGELVWDLGNPWAGVVAMTEGRGRRLRMGVWRAQKLPPDHPGLAGKTLLPLDPQPEPTPIEPEPEEDEDEGSEVAPDGGDEATAGGDPPGEASPPRS
ncbi:MAG TPA: aryl-sulfate sulfotransferase [Thermoanaerobaculia bacterium]|nr:aryl-sulfate sulfotransferase [Thermoanaerobaculia bacterium]